MIDMVILFCHISSITVGQVGEPPAPQSSPEKYPTYLLHYSNYRPASQWGPEGTPRSQTYLLHYCRPGRGTSTHSPDLQSNPAGTAGSQTFQSSCLFLQHHPHLHAQRIHYHSHQTVYHLHHHPLDHSEKKHKI